MSVLTQCEWVWYGFSGRMYTKYIYILLHDWEGNAGRYSVRDRRVGRYRGRERNISPYCPTRGMAIIDSLYDFRVTIGTGNNERLYKHG